MARTDPGSGAEPHSGWQRGLFAGGRAHFRICDSELKFMEMSRNAGPSKALGQLTTAGAHAGLQGKGRQMSTKSVLIHGASLMAFAMASPAWAQNAEAAEGEIVVTA